MTTKIGIDGEKGFRTRRRIMEAAAEILATKGYSGTRLSDIAAVADVQAPAIYYYFSSREELIETVMMEGTGSAIDHVKKILADMADASPTVRLAAAIEAHLRIALELSSFALASIRNSGQLPPEMRHNQLQAENRYGQIWRGLISAVKDAGLLRPAIDPTAGQMLLIGALNWAPEWWTPKSVPLDEVVETAKNMILHGLLAEPPTERLDAEDPQSSCNC